MYIGTRAQETPNKPAIINANTGVAVTYGQLDLESMRVARLLHARGLRRGDRIAIYMENHLSYMAVIWAALRSGLCAVPVNRYFNAQEVAYVVNDCSAKAIFTTLAQAEVVSSLSDSIPNCQIRLIADGGLPGWEGYEATIERYDASRLDVEAMGTIMSYTSGTTGRPKGVLRPLPDMDATEAWAGWSETGGLYNFDAETVYLSPAPLYHGAPMRFCRAVHMAGGTVVMMEKFDAETALQLIARYRVTHSQWVPTMFARMLKLDASVRNLYDLSSHHVAVHAAAPCPIDVKRQMIAWWGPIVHEYYGGTDSAGITAISCEEWLQHPGSVGRADPARVKVCLEDGTEAAIGQAGTVYLVGKSGSLPEYLNDPEKTRAARHPEHDDWVTGGDVGIVREDGYLYLTDRKAFTIISGGVNIYPQVIEDALIEHPLVGDAAVFGVPNEEMGEEVKAVIELADGIMPSAAVADELIAYCKSRVARYMVPRSVEFVEKLPRSAAGKLMKKELRDRYWVGRSLVA
ncbi:long-chain-fatty-acid--CoA ligase [Burkholderia cepacia]|uniref:Long-chain-fatty-acid--CoA ligase n=2 Tax=Bacteria TaxID=2 RepID=A0AAE8NI95_BURCE|nr:MULTISPECIES: AMP-binding protein [Burkholderia]POM14059.1 Long-chain-fatty-acid--CoA ligase FadD13 [Burkholderia cepacia]SQA51854.1 long-chain-fatty-acid--CoA ligase [Burkholderia cepacia]